MSDELAADITDTKAELKEVKATIKIIQTGDDAASEALVKKLRFKDSDAALADLRAKEVELDKRLTTYEIRLTALQQQQQSGAGTSMLPVRQFVVMPSG
jgi:prefoldin subunit 5